MREAKNDLARLKSLKQSKSYACNVDFNWLVNTLQSYIGGWVEGREISMELVAKINAKDELLASLAAHLPCPADILPPNVAMTSLTAGSDIFSRRADEANDD